MMSDVVAIARQRPLAESSSERRFVQAMLFAVPWPGKYIILAEDRVLEEA